VAGIRRLLVDRYAPASANRHLSVLRSLVGHLWLTGVIDADTRDRLRQVAKGTKGQRMPAGGDVAGDEIHGMIVAAKQGPEPLASRDVALVAALAGSGLGRAEAASLRLCDVRRPQEGVVVLRLTGNGDTEREAPLSGRSAETLWTWVQYLAETLRWTDDDPLFPAVERGRLVLRPMSGPAIRKRVVALAKRADVEHTSAHDMRRTMVSGLLRGGVDLPAVQLLAGHASPATTARYDRRPAEEAFVAGRCWDPLA
jgi:site-specific recombinase XerD